MNYAEMMHEVCIDVIEIVKVKKNPDFNFLIRKGQLAILNGAVGCPTNSQTVSKVWSCMIRSVILQFIIFKLSNLPCFPFVDFYLQ